LIPQPGSSLEPGDELLDHFVRNTDSKVHFGSKRSAALFVDVGPGGEVFPGPLTLFDQSDMVRKASGKLNAFTLAVQLDIVAVEVKSESR